MSEYGFAFGDIGARRLRHAIDDLAQGWFTRFLRDEAMRTIGVAWALGVWARE